MVEKRKNKSRRNFIYYQIREIYPHSKHRRFLQRHIYSIFENIYRNQIEPFYFLASQDHDANKLNELQVINRPFVFQILMALLSLEYIYTIPIFEIVEVNKKSEAHPILYPKSSNKVCPCCKSRKKGKRCTDFPFWDYFQIWKKTDLARFMEIRRCDTEGMRKLYIYENTSDYAKIDKNGKVRCPNCGSEKNETLKLSMKSCTNCHHTFLAKQWYEIDEVEPRQKTRLNLEDLLSRLITKSLVYDQRAFPDLPFHFDELRTSEAEVYRKISEDEAQKYYPYLNENQKPINWDIVLKASFEMEVHFHGGLEWLYKSCTSIKTNS